MSLPRLDLPCPNCDAKELFDATTTTEHPHLYEKYSKFRGNRLHRVYCCFKCKTIAHFLREEDDSLTLLRWARPTQLPTKAEVDIF